MPGIAKSVNVIGLLGKEEVVNGTPVAVSPTLDGLRLWLDTRDGLSLNPAYLDDGFLAEAPGGLGVIRRTTPRGKSTSFEGRTFFQGAGAPYSATALPSLHKWLKACGHDAVIVTALGLEKVTYTPTLEGQPITTLTLEAYTRKEKWPLSFGIGNWRYEVDDRGTMRHLFAMNAIAGANVDAVLPAITYPLLSVLPPSIAGVQVQMGDYQLVGIKRLAWDMGRVLEERTGADASDIHLGWGPRNRTPAWTIEVEQTAFVGTPFHTAAGFNPWKLWETMQAFPLSIRHPGAQYNRWLHSAGQCQLKQVPEASSVAGIATTVLTIEPTLASPGGNDDYLFECD